MKQQELSFIAGENQKLVQPTLEDSLALSYKIKHVLTIDPAIALLGIYPKELKTYVHTKTCTWMFIATYILIHKQPRCPSVDEWINCGTSKQRDIIQG